MDIYEDRAPTSPDMASSFVEILRWRAAHQPSQPAYTFLVHDQPEQPVGLSYSELDRQAARIGALLQRAEATGERVLLLYPPGLEYIAAFFGCLYAGAIAVPAYPPHPSQLKRTLPRLQAIMRDARPRVVLTTAEVLPFAELLRAHDPECSQMRWLATDAADDDQAQGWQPPAVDQHTLAFLQYTSGSTGTPKGVMLNHGNLLHNSERIRQCFEHTLESRGVIWLPPYHDMGLIGGILQPLYAGFPVTLMSPLSFLQDPFRWLEAIARSGATTSGGPNFAYELCVRKVSPEQRARLDLSSWTVAFCGAEPVRSETLDRFAAAFEPCGFRREAFYPCYGLAEATLIVSGGQKTAPPVVRAFGQASLEQGRVGDAAPEDEAGRRMVGCGRAPPGHRIIIADRGSLTACAPGEVGEIWVSGPSVAQGYWNRPEETRQTFRAQLAGSAAEPFLRTGDLGFVQDGELFVAGRIKDLIIIRGNNYYPQDIELTVEQSHPALRPGAGAAFSIDVDGEERLVIVQERDRWYRDQDLDSVFDAIRQAVAEQHELHAYAIMLLEPGSIPKTSSGKIQRYACRAAFLSGGLHVVGSSILEGMVQPRGAHLTRDALLAAEPAARHALVADYLRERMAEMLRMAPDRLDPQRPLIALGLDSLMAVELQQQLVASLGVDVPLARFLEGASIDQLAAQVLAGLETPVADTAGPALTAPREAADTFALSHGQEALWFMHQLAPESATNVLAFTATIHGALDTSALRHAFQALIDRHAALRTTFGIRGGKPVQIVHEHLPLALAEEDATGWSQADLHEHLRQETRRPFDLASGPPLRVDIFHRSPQERVLLLVAPHLVADYWSLAILIRELGLLATVEQTGSPAPLAPLTLQYTDFVRWETDMLASPAGERLWAYWLRSLAGELPLLRLPTDRPRPLVQTYRGAAMPFELDAGITRRLKALGEQQGTTLYTILLAAFQILLYHYTDQDDILVGSPMAGRSRAEWSGLVGSFARPVVLRANLAGNPTFFAFLDQVHRTVLGALEHQAFPFSLLVERLQPIRDPGWSPIFQVMFTFLNVHFHDARDLAAYGLGIAGVRMQLGELQLESLPLSQPVNQFDLTLIMAELGGRLIGSLQYNTDLFNAASMERIAEHFCAVVEAIVAQPDQQLAGLLARISKPTVTLAIASTFTSDPLEESLSFWMRQLGMPATIRFAPYNQVFQQLLDPASLLMTNKHGVNIVLLRLEDLLYADEGRNIGDERQLERNAQAFIQALQAAVERTPAPFLVGLCPPADAALADSNSEALQHTYASIRAQLAALSGIHVLDLAGAAARYRVEGVHNPLTDRLGHIPFTPEYFAAVGTCIARTLFALRTPPYKVIAVDCDQTLWQGLCGEDGPCGVQIESHHDTLQQFLVKQYHDGMLLCLCSRNNIDDVIEVFHAHPEIPLNLSHFVSRRVNWGAKSENLMSLAQELGLSLDSFIFLDDDPLECAEVQAHCPDTLSLVLPAAPDEIPAFLEHVWAFDGLKRTEESRRRSLLYEQNRQREQFRAESATIADFLAGLRLEVDVAPAQPQHVARIAELTQRTNQFNTTTIRYSEGQIAQLLAEGQATCRVVEVRDRFGDYGLVGVILSRCEHGTLHVDSLLLSCRVLGRGVEDILLGELAKLAREQGCARIDFAYRSTGRNIPALQFLERIASERAPVADDSAVFVYILAEASASPDHADAPAATKAAAAPKAGPVPPGPSTNLFSIGAQERAVLLTRIAAQFRTAEQVLSAIRSQKRERPDLETPYVAPRTTVEQALANIWADVLGLEQVGIHDHFFALGGHSLMAVQIISRLHDSLQFEAPLISLFFETPTVAGLASVIEQYQIEQASEDTVIQMLKELEDLSDEEVRMLLDAEE